MTLIEEIERLEEIYVQPFRKPQGFAALSPEKKREIASKGGKAAHAQGTAHEWTSETAREAGRKGGSISRRGPAKEGKS